jgi:hypothetical protein
MKACIASKSRCDLRRPMRARRKPSKCSRDNKDLISRSIAAGLRLLMYSKKDWSAEKLVRQWCVGGRRYRCNPQSPFGSSLNNRRVNSLSANRS